MGRNTGEVVAGNTGNSTLEVYPSLGEELSSLALEDGGDDISPFENGSGSQ
jgi:hypothetical protein